MRKSFTRQVLSVMLVTLMLTLTALAGTTGTIEADSLRLRKKPSLKSRVIDLVPNGETVLVTGRTPTVNKDGSWHKVTYKNKNGYMSADYLSLSGESSEGGIIQANVRTRLNLRTKPSTDASIVTVLPKGKSVEVVNEKKGGWSEVKSSKLSGYVKSEFLVLPNDSSNTQKKPLPATGKYGIVSASRVNLRAKASTGSRILEVLSINTVVDIEKITEKGWYSVSVNGTDGFIHPDYLTATDEKPKAPEKKREKASATAEAIIETASKKLGAPYVYGSGGPNSFDCSGFTSWVFRQHGISLPRNSGSQYRLSGKSVKKPDLKTGDLVFFKNTSKGVINHVGIYLGGNKFIHAGSGSNGGRKVKISSLSEGSYTARYVGAKRVV
ncbi:MAG: C40 family peptidase [Oscillospiraceae bacterium]|nr:C40 family peptidase [Oscillospiraceae bacterium]